MSRQLYTITGLGLGDGATNGDASYSSDERIQVASTHQVTVQTDGAATGTIKIIYVAKGVEFGVYSAEILKDSAFADIVIDLADGTQSYTFDGSIGTIGVVAASSITGGCQITLSGF